MNYDVVIIGSGYGGSVIAARLAGKAKVLLVERGRRHGRGDFPKTLTQLARAYRHTSNPLGLWQLRIGEGVGNGIVSGLGGASLANYGITERPPDSVLDDWALTPRELDPYYQRALSVLAPEPYPRRDELGDAAFLDRVEPGRRVDLRNTIDWTRCTLCGNCVSGCNEGAKRSLDRTYLPLAEAGGVELRCETEVIDCAPLAPKGDASGSGAQQGAGYRLALRPTAGGPLSALTTRQVVLAGGCFGSLDFLARQRSTLPTTPAFGERMSMNGDALFFLYNSGEPLSGEHGAPLSTTARFETPGADGRPRAVTIISGRMPMLIMPLVARAIPVLTPLLPGERSAGATRGFGPLAAAKRLWRQLRDVAKVDATGALASTFMYKLDGQDAARGRARITASGEVVMDWPDYGDDPVLRFGRERLASWAAQVGGRTIDELGRWPLVGRSFGVHPLGGCALGDEPQGAVVDTRLRLFRPDGEVHPGFRVVDASVLPGSLGVPPSLTISALAERAAEDLLGEIG
jgi:cholesterol oxidase